MDEQTGREAAIEAAELLRRALMLLNATDIGRDKGLVRLASSGEGTVWDATVDALGIIIAALHPDIDAGNVVERVFDAGKSVAWCADRERRDVRADALAAAQEERYQARYDEMIKAGVSEMVADRQADREAVLWAHAERERLAERLRAGR